MSCLQNSVGIRLCDTSKSWYVDDIAGISVNMVSALKPDEKQAFSAYFNQIKQSAYTQFLTEVEIKFSGEKSFNHIVSETSSFTTDKSHRLSTPTDVLEGFSVVIPTHEFVEYHLKNINLVCHQPGNIEIKVIDMISGSVAYAQTSALVKGKNKVVVNYVHSDPEKELFIAIRNIDAVLSSVLCGDTPTTSCTGGCSSCTCETESSDYGTITSYSIDTFEAKTHKFFCIDAQVRCNFETMLCNYPEFFYNAFTHFFGIRILDDKVNSYVRGWYSDANNKTVTEETLPSLKARFHMLLDLALTNLQAITNDSICWSCNSRLQTKPSLKSLV